MMLLSELSWCALVLFCREFDPKPVKKVKLIFCYEVKNYKKSRRIAFS